MCICILNLTHKHGGVCSSSCQSFVFLMGNESDRMRPVADLGQSPAPAGLQHVHGESSLARLPKLPCTEIMIMKTDLIELGGSIANVFRTWSDSEIIWLYMRLWLSVFSALPANRNISWVCSHQCSCSAMAVTLCWFWIYHSRGEPAQTAANIFGLGYFGEKKGHCFVSVHGAFMHTHILF